MAAGIGLPRILENTPLWRGRDCGYGRWLDGSDLSGSSAADPAKLAVFIGDFHGPLSGQVLRGHVPGGLGSDQLGPGPGDSLAPLRFGASA